MRTAVIIGLVVVIAAAAAGAWLVYGGPEPQAVAEQYLQRITAQDFSAVEQYFDPEQPHPAGTELEQGFRRFADAYGLEGIEDVQLEKKSESWQAAEYSYKLRYTSRFFEPLEIESTLKLRRTGLLTWKVQWADDLPLPEYGLEARYRRDREQPTRGAILDRNGDVLAGQGTVVSIGVQPNRISDRERLHQALQEQLGLDPDYVRSKYEAPGVQGHWFVPLITVSEEEYARVDPSLRPIPGVFFRREESRAYPLGQAAAHLTGYIGEVTANMIDRFPEREYTAGEIVGRAGLELAFDDTLRGRPGLKFYVEPPEGEAVLLAQRAVVHGKDVYLTVDGAYQRTAFEVLGDYAGAFVVLDANTGEILAAASSPSYDPEEFIMGISAQRWSELSNDPEQPMFNRAFQGLYPPGSIFKVVTGSAALDQGVHTVASQFNDTGELRVEGNIVRNFERQSFGLHVFPDAIVNSINTTMAQVGLDLGASLLKEYFSRWKLDTSWDLGLNLRAGQVGDPARSRVALAWSAIGQDRVLLTPIHVAQIFTAFAGEGVVPEIVITPRDEGAEAPLYEVLTADTAEEMRGILARVVQEGTGTAARVEGIHLIGKTGTAETTDETHAWFGGIAFDFAQRDLAFAVLVEGGGIGGRIAAPLVREFFTRLSAQ